MMVVVAGGGVRARRRTKRIEVVNNEASQGRERNGSETDATLEDVPQSALDAKNSGSCRIMAMFWRAASHDPRCMVAPPFSIPAMQRERGW